VSYALLFIDKHGRERHEMDGDLRIIYRTKKEAQEMADFWREGVGEDFQSIAVVRWAAPTPAKEPE
jgi:hypothetical protein